MSTMCSLFCFLICLSSSMHVYCEARYIGRRSGHNKGPLSAVEKSSLGIDSGTKGSVLVKKADIAAGDLKSTNHEAAGANSSTKIKGTTDYPRTIVVNRGKSSSSRNPGIYSDYSRPRTRPPSHN